MQGYGYTTTVTKLFANTAIIWFFAVCLQLQTCMLFCLAFRVWLHQIK